MAKVSPREYLKGSLMKSKEDKIRQLADTDFTHRLALPAEEDGNYYVKSARVVTCGRDTPIVVYLAKRTYDRGQRYLANSSGHLLRSDSTLAAPSRPSREPVNSHAVGRTAMKPAGSASFKEHSFP